MKDFRLSENEKVGDNITRILHGQMDVILQHCKADGKDRHQSVHEIRKSMKKIRAVLRLIRDEIGFSSYYRENIKFRDLARQLSELRNRIVLAETTGKIQEDFTPAARKHMRQMQDELFREGERLYKILLDDQDTFRKISAETRAAKKRVEHFQFHHEDFRAFEGGLHRIYRQGRKLYHKAQGGHDPGLLHDMRKRMKYLWYQVELLQPIYPKMLKAYAKSLNNITEILGICHDLDELIAEARDKKKITHANTLKQLEEIQKRSKEELLDQIWHKVAAVYTEEPDAFVNRLAGYWEIFHKQKARTGPGKLNPAKKLV